MDTETIRHSKLLWDYMSSFAQTAKSDAVVVCCSYDLRVCDYACNLIKSGVSETLVLSGNTGNWTKHIWRSPEASVFFDRAIINGVSPRSIIVEDKATNFGENVAFSKALLTSSNSISFVSKPNSLLRVKLTADAQWPEAETYVACPTINFPQKVSNVVGVLGIINEMVGDIERILRYPEMGFQAPHQLPENILYAWEYLKNEGFTEHLIRPI